MFHCPQDSRDGLTNCENGDGNDRLIVMFPGRNILYETIRTRSRRLWNGVPLLVLLSIYHAKSAETLEGQVPAVEGCQGLGLRRSRGKPTSVSCELPAPEHRPSLACTL